MKFLRKNAFESKITDAIYQRKAADIQRIILSKKFDISHIALVNCQNQLKVYLSPCNHKPSFAFLQLLIYINAITHLKINCCCVSLGTKRAVMEATSRKFTTVEEYISTFSGNTKTLLEQLRKIIKEAAPQAEETISYNMPAYKLHGVLVYFAGYKNHIGFYPTGSGIKEFEKLLTKFTTSKGTVQFPIEENIPVNLVTKMVKFRVKENLQKKEAKKLKKLPRKKDSLRNK